MRKYIILLLIYISITTITNAQDYDLKRTQSFINQVLRDNYSDTTGLKIHLISETYKTILPTATSKEYVYKELEQFINIYELDSIIEFYIKKNDFKWRDVDSLYHIIDGVEGSKIIQKSNVIIIDSKRKKNRYSNTLNIKNIVIKTSEPLFITDSLCLILISFSTGNLTGSKCLYLYQNEKNIWKKLKVISCYYR